MKSYAIIQVGSHQFKASPGEILTLEKIEGKVGTEVRFNRVLAVSDGSKLKTGTDLKTVVTGEIKSQTKGKKIFVFKKIRRHGYKRTQGHRQQYTQIEIKSIEG